MSDSSNISPSSSGPSLEIFVIMKNPGWPSDLRVTFERSNSKMPDIINDLKAATETTSPLDIKETEKRFYRGTQVLNELRKQNFSFRGRKENDQIWCTANGISFTLPEPQTGDRLPVGLIDLYMANGWLPRLQLDRVAAEDPLDHARPRRFAELDRVVSIREIMGSRGKVASGTPGVVLLVHNQGEAYEVEFDEPLHTVLCARPVDLKTP